VVQSHWGPAFSLGAGLDGLYTKPREPIWPSYIRCAHPERHNGVTMITKYLVALALMVAVTIVCLLEISWIESEMHQPFFSGAQTQD
jgi:hypothetical protein